jgi:hypothetical protein
MDTTPRSSSNENSLPPLPSNHGFAVGDRVEMPMLKNSRTNQTAIRGEIKYIDLCVGKRLYKGLVLLGDDNCYYEFHPEIARKLKP